MKVLITGASGFIGKNFLLKAPKDWKIFAFYNSSSDFPDFIKENSLSNTTPVKCDLLEKEQIKTFFSSNNDFDVCLYLAANANPTISVQDPKLDFDLNVTALINFLTYFKGKKLIFFSSGAVYDGIKGPAKGKPLDPKLPYAISKLAAEQYINFFHKERHDFSNYVILRFFGAYGPHEPERKIYSQLVRSFGIEKNHEFTIRGDGTNLIDAMFIDDAIEGILKIIESERTSNKVIDFCIGNPLTIKELILEAAKTFGINNPDIITQGTTAEPISFIGSSKEMKEICNFTPKTSLSDGLKILKDFCEKTA
ncbi:MAG: NAD(P)-dependent oxidoreductase [Candidatus Woesearchaeota archaeon]